MGEPADIPTGSLSERRPTRSSPFNTPAHKGNERRRGDACPRITLAPKKGGPSPAVAALAPNSTAIGITQRCVITSCAGEKEHVAGAQVVDTPGRSSTTFSSCAIEEGVLVAPIEGAIHRIAQSPRRSDASQSRRCGILSPRSRICGSTPSNGSTIPL